MNTKVLIIAAFALAMPATQAQSAQPSAMNGMNMKGATAPACRRRCRQ